MLSTMHFNLSLLQSSYLLYASGKYPMVRVPRALASSTCFIQLHRASPPTIENYSMVPLCVKSYEHVSCCLSTY